MIPAELLIDCQGRQLLLAREPPASLRSIQLDGKHAYFYLKNLNAGYVKITSESRMTIYVISTTL